MNRHIFTNLVVCVVVGAFSATSFGQVIIINPRNPVKDAEDNAKSLLNEWVKTYLDRKPTEKETNTMMQRLRMGTHPALVQASILGTEEYLKKNGGTTGGFLTGLYSDVLGRKITAAEKLQLTAKVNGMGREKFAVEFLKSTSGPVNPFANPNLPPTIIVP